jgi:hypothetical protein
MEPSQMQNSPKEHHEGKAPPKTRAPPDDTDKLAYSIQRASHASGLSRSLLYVAIGEGKLRARKCGARTVILREDLQQFLASLPAMKAAA